MNTTVYLVGRVIVPTKQQPHTWEVMGIFREENHARRVAAEKGGFVGPAILNELFPDKPIPWPGGYFPSLSENQP